VTTHLQYFLMKMMAKDREIRYQSPAELVEDIETQILGKKTLVFNPEGGPSGVDDIFKAPQAVGGVAEPVEEATPAPRRRRRRRR
jgi:hypothetical protein